MIRAISDNPVVRFITSLPKNKRNLAKTVCVLAILAIGARQSQTAPRSYAYQLRCGLNTTAKKVFSALSGYPLRLPSTVGTQFNSSTLVGCLQAINHEGFAHICELAAFTGTADVTTFPSDKRYIVIPVVVEGIMGNHITLLFCENQLDGSLSIEFYDGKALPIDDPKNKNAEVIYTSLKSKHPQHTFKELQKPIQFDAHNCGAYVCWFSEQRLSGKTFEEIQNGPAPAIEQYRAALLLRKAK